MLSEVMHAHTKIYLGTFLFRATQPPLYSWICSGCGEFGSDELAVPPHQTAVQQQVDNERFRVTVQEFGGVDRLQRRQSIIDGFKTPYQFAERIMQLEDECRSIRAEYERSDEKACHFHRKRLGEMNGSTLYQCEVCNTVQAYVEPALA